MMFLFPQFGGDIWSYIASFPGAFSLDFPPVAWLGFPLRQEMMKRVTAFAQEKEKTYEAPTGTYRATTHLWRLEV